MGKAGRKARKVAVKMMEKITLSLFLISITLLLGSCPPQRSPEFIFNSTKGDIVIQIIYDFPQDEKNGDEDNWINSWHKPDYYSIRVERSIFLQEIIRASPDSGSAEAERKNHTVTILLPAKKCICVDEGMDAYWKSNVRECKVIRADNTSFKYDRSIRENSDYVVCLTNGNSTLESEVGKIITVK